MRRFVLLTGLGMAGFLVACTSLLGDFEVGKASTTGGDGGGDAATDGATGTTDGDGGAEAGLPLLRCRVAGQPVLLDKSAGSPFMFVRALRSGTQTRIVAVKSPPTGFSLYTLSGGPPKTQNVASGPVYDVSPIPGGIGVLTATPGAANPNPTFAVIKIPDTADTPSTPEVIAASTTTNVNSASFAAFGADDYFVTATFSTAPNVAEVRAGRRKPGAPAATLYQVARGASNGETRMRDIVHISGHVLLFNDQGPDQAQGGGAGFLRVPEEPAADNVASVSPIPPIDGHPLVNFAATGNEAQSSLRIAVGEINFAAGTARLRAGGIGAAQAEPIDMSKLPVAYDLQSYFDAPIKGETKWVNTDVVAVGSGLAGKGLNFFWYDAAQSTMRAVAIGQDALIADRTPSQATFASKSLLGGIGDLDIVWTEDPGAGSADGTLWTAQVACAR